MIVDAHSHAALRWFEPVEALLGQMDRNDVHCAVLVQIRGEYDNEYSMRCVERHADRLVAVVAVDPRQQDAERQLERLKERGARGVRLWLPVRDGAAWRLWEAAAALDLPISCSGAAADFASDDFAMLLESMPRLPIVLEHLGTSLSRDRGGVPDEVWRKVLALSRFPNTHIKIHGLGEFATRAAASEPFPFERPIPPRLREAYHAFGAARMMWGSNHPPVSALEGYRNALRLTADEFSDVSPHERELIFGGTAARVYGLASWCAEG